VDAPEQSLPAEPGELANSAPEPKGRWQKLAPLLPWMSLAISISSGVLMNRSEARAGLIAGASAASWLVLVLVLLVHRPTPESAAESGRFQRALRFTTAAANQSLVQLSLLFCAPFYAQAFVLTPLELLFAVLFVLAMLISLWDPLCARVLRSHAFGPLLIAFASFVVWNAVLPMLGIPHRISVWLACGVVALALPLVHVLHGSLRTQLFTTLGVSLLFPLLLFVGGIRALPPAPLRVMQAAIGTQVVERALVDASTRFAHPPAQLICFTAIRAPAGLADDLVHVWQHAGEITQRIPLTVHGGRRAGFRTWSRIPLTARSRGTYRCDVLTSLGQLLGSAQATVGE
jgi:hypothetical protein